MVLGSSSREGYSQSEFPTPEEAIAAAGRVLGFGRITAETRAGIELAIRKMVQNGELHDQGGQLMIPSHSGGMSRDTSASSPSS